MLRSCNMVLAGPIGETAMLAGRPRFVAGFVALLTLLARVLRLAPTALWRRAAGAGQCLDRVFVHWFPIFLVIDLNKVL